ncbi:hypothetical protein LPJ66_000008 [Kickxella alabastrina]|uniref:Uncharacterized protein n=1 Tax=Kickxella alabastrina TaxID=61397 RepID=A0ACC1IX67_9FUNG|nr:hypothetical protein LPJ66_000008 [Kickxella alabastrina]
MLRLTTVIFTLIAAATANQCSGNAAICPNNQDGVSSSYLQCDNWAKKYITTPCPLDKSATLIPQLPTPSCALLQGRAVSLELASALDTRPSVQTMDRAVPTIAASHGLASMSTTNVPLDSSATTMMPARVSNATK